VPGTSAQVQWRYGWSLESRASGQVPPVRGGPLPFALRAQLGLLAVEGLDWEQGLWASPFPREELDDPPTFLDSRQRSDSRWTLRTSSLRYETLCATGPSLLGYQGRQQPREATETSWSDWSTGRRGELPSPTNVVNRRGDQGAVRRGMVEEESRAAVWYQPRAGFQDRSQPLMDCREEPASQWAPAGYVCGPQYGIGWASMWGGPGVARNDCVYPWTDCPPLRVTSLQTGLSITVMPVTWCMCWVGVTGPNGEQQRIIDLDLSQVAALGLDPSRGLWKVRVTPASPLPTTLLPDTATR
jgi:hypothetical protein